MSAAPGNLARILVVDDSTVIRLAIKKMLSSEFEVAIAADGEAGWEKLLADDQIKCLITDIEMPVLDGYAFICRARAAEQARIRDMPIIAITGAEDEETRVRAYACGATDFITKPLDRTKLQGRIQAYVKQEEPAAVPAALPPEESGTDAVAEDAGIDPVTQLHSRRYFLGHGERDLAQCASQGQDLSVVRVDIDNFKKLYRQHGDDAADQILIHVAKSLSGAARPEDTVARVGGAEFALLLPAVPRAEAVQLCESMVARIAEKPVAFNDQAVSVSASMGIAALRADKRDSVTDLLALAEQRLGHAKAEGGNRTSIGVLGEAVEPEELTLAAPTDAALPDLEFPRDSLSLDFLSSDAQAGSPGASSLALDSSLDTTVLEPLSLDTSSSVEFESVLFEQPVMLGDLPTLELDEAVSFGSATGVPASLISIDKALQALARGEREQVSRYLPALVGEILPLLELYKRELPEDLQACAERLIEAVRRAQ